jgi:dCTP deaminase
MTPEKERARESNYPAEGGRRSEEIEIQSALLSKSIILTHIEAGNIIIDPLDKENIGGASVDVKLGQWYWREKETEQHGLFQGAVNLWEKRAPEQLWTGPFQAPSAQELLEDLWGKDNLPTLEGSGLSPDDRIIFLKNGENILGHTLEFIGGNNQIGTAMQARSSLGRSNITVCRCAGWGDPGYFNRWTMEITNNSQNHSVVLVVGRRVAQIVFWEVSAVEGSYQDEGKYQTSSDLEQVKSLWEPSMMLPQLYLDREVGERARRIGPEKPPPLITYTAIPTEGTPKGIPIVTNDRDNERQRFTNWGLLPADTRRIREDINRGDLPELILD